MDKPSLKQLLADRDKTLSAIAVRFGLYRSTVWRWDRNGVPAERVAEVSDFTGIPREELRPDIFAKSESVK